MKIKIKIKVAESGYGSVTSVWFCVDYHIDPECLITNLVCDGGLIKGGSFTAFLYCRASAEEPHFDFILPLKRETKKVALFTVSEIRQQRVYIVEPPPCKITISRETIL